jgi:hypothetical protein
MSIKKYHVFESEDQNSSSLTEDQIKFLDRCTTRDMRVSKTWRVNSDGLVDVRGDFDLRLDEGNLIHGIKFGTINGFFCCEGSLSSGKLEDLSGFPRVVEGYFSCIGNELTSLKGGPEIVHGNYYAGANKLISMEGGPKELRGNFSAKRNPVSHDTLSLLLDTMQAYNLPYKLALEEIATQLPYEDIELLDHEGIDENVWKLIVSYTRIKNTL